MTIATDSVLRVVATFTLGALTRAQNVYHMRHLTGTPQLEGDVVQAALEAVEEYMNNFVSTIHQTVELETVEVFERVDGKWEPIGQIASTWAGTGSSSDRVPAGLALMVNLFKLRTGYNDRKFICGFMEGAISGEEWSGTVISNAGNYVTDVYSPFTATNSVQLKACHFNRETEETKDYVGGHGVARIAYQRRRKPGVGLT